MDRPDSVLFPRRSVRGRGARAASWAAILACLFCARTALAEMDYSVWELQEPDGLGRSPAVVGPARLEAGYSDAYFYLTRTGQAFMDPATGVATRGSRHPRCELREMNAGSRTAWASTGVNTLAVSGKVLELGGGASGKTTLGQVFDADASIPLCELIYSAALGGFEVLYEEAKGSGTYTDLDVSAVLGRPYHFVLSLSHGVLSVSLNGSVAFTRRPGAGVLAHRFYFKCGDYDQTAAAGPADTAPYTLVEDDGIVVTHGEATP